MMRFRRANQIGFVVQEMRPAVEELSRSLGIRRWYKPVNKDSGEILYRGRKVDCEVEFVLGFCGGSQIELITSRGEPNLYTEFLDRAGPGMHHICFFVSDLDRRLAEYASQGIRPLQTGTVTSKGGSITRYAYLEPTSAGGLVVELSEARLAGRVPVSMTPFLMEVGRITGDLEPFEGGSR